jgi:hypothetical protein
MRPIIFQTPNMIRKSLRVEDLESGSYPGVERQDPNGCTLLGLPGSPREHFRSSLGMGRKDAVIEVKVGENSLNFSVYAR